jgi:hypothetical protein
MQFSTGKDMFGRFVYREIVAPERLVFINSFSDANGGITRAPFPQIGPTWPLEVLNTLTLSEQAGQTTLTLRGGPINATDEERKTFAGMFDSLRQGFTGTFDQLAAYLANTLTGGQRRNPCSHCSNRADFQQGALGRPCHQRSGHLPAVRRRHEAHTVGGRGGDFRAAQDSRELGHPRHPPLAAHPMRSRTSFSAQSADGYRAASRPMPYR